ncbi:SRPBCC domain-containing protein [Tabrizicola sp.]|uniref:SRPBCC domain-containing protein n=1 Tax=Tabrizicola sp. TaxID=2005166 RepID=UPI002734355E|nr:SRPBCC domain-containing protein [Tabrizicola sp.]MDP3197102.1 SRPBCC domain-containing protein [Tabrizicola sp.]MDZ4068381.1 SRPBCC domain-containing protein [Tabrizicola sp.]
MSRDQVSDRFATLTFERSIAAPVATLYAAWISPAARAVWAATAPSVTVEFLEADSRVGGREVSLCKVAGEPDLRVEGGWLDLVPEARTVGYEVVSKEGDRQSAALVTADFAAEGETSRIKVTVQLASLAADMADGYRQGFNAGIDNLRAVAERTLLLQRVIKAPVPVVWGAWMNSESLPKWWGPDGFSCRTSRIDLRAGGEWVFDMIGPDGTVFPNHHKYGAMIPEARLDYTLHWGENGPKHADAWATFEDQDGATKVTLGMVMATAKEYHDAKGFGAVELGLQTLGKLAKIIGAE